MRGAVKISDEIDRRKLNIAVTGIPKTVDNDRHHWQIIWNSGSSRNGPVSKPCSSYRGRECS